MTSTTASQSRPSPAVTVVGSMNCDLSFFVRGLPRPHETVMAHRSAVGVGGKGLNQAAAAARDGARVHMIGAIGDDGFGGTVRAYAKQCGLDLTGLKTVCGVPTGTAAILIDSAGANMIAVSPGANAHLHETDIHTQAALIENAAILVAQLEVPVETVSAAMRLARAAGVRTLLNPAPATENAKDLLHLASLVSPNETEAQSLTGILPNDAHSAQAAAAALCALGAGAVVITMGAKGHYVYENGAGAMHPAFAVEAVDTTGAGDVFNGVLAHRLAQGCSVTEAARAGAAAAALSVTKAGAEGAAPDRDSIDSFLNNASNT